MLKNWTLLDDFYTYDFDEKSEIFLVVTPAKGLWSGYIAISSDTVIEETRVYKTPERACADVCRRAERLFKMMLRRLR